MESVTTCHWPDIGVPIKVIDLAVSVSTATLSPVSLNGHLSLMGFSVAVNLA